MAYRPRQFTWWLWFALLIVAAGIALFATGCKAAPTALSDKSQQALNGITGALERAKVRAQNITFEAKTLPTSESKVRITRDAGGIEADVIEGGAKLDEANTSIRLMAGSINNLETEKAVQAAELKRLNNVWVAPRMWRLIAWIVAGFFAAGIASIVLGVLSPVGWGISASRLINTILPLSTPFVLIRDTIRKSRGYPVGP